LNTSPMEPAPSWPSMRYAPRIVPGVGLATALFYCEYGGLSLRWDRFSNRV
jgi:hypothetical protein